MRISLAVGALALGALSALPQAAHPSHRPLTSTQAQRMAAAAARHDRIDLSDTHIELNSMDLGADFIPGYASFIIIRESNVQGPDETLRRYAVNRRTGEVWEMTLCTHYDFPELTRMRRGFALRAASSEMEIAAESRQLGCSEQKQAQ
jgi:hypothetical protein